MIPLLESPAAQRLAWTLLHFLWQGALLGLAAWGAFALLRRQRPQLRYLVGCAFLFLCLGSASATFLVLAPAAGGPSPAAILAQAAPPLELLPEPEPVTGLDAPAPSRPWRDRLRPCLPWILGGWAAGVLCLSLRAAGGWLWLRRLKATAHEIAEPEWLQHLVARTGLRRTVRFLESARVITPLCMGLLRPVVLLPLGFFANLDPVAAEAVLAHELAHIRRLDGLVNGLQCLVEVLFFFHPAVWWLSRRIRTEREHCCDDAAVLACGDAVYYAEILVRLDDLRERPPSLALSAQGGNLMERMRRLLRVDPPQLRFATPGLALVVALALMGTLPAQAEKPAATPRVEEALPGPANPTAPPEQVETATPQASPRAERIPSQGAAPIPAAGAAATPVPVPAPAPAPTHTSSPASPVATPHVQTSPVQGTTPPAPTPAPAQPASPSPVLQARDLEVVPGLAIRTLKVPRHPVVIEDELLTWPDKGYAVDVPARTTISFRVTCESGEAYFRVGVADKWGKRLPGMKGSLGVPWASFANETDQPISVTFFVRTAKGYPGDGKIRAHVAAAPTSRVVTSSPGTAGKPSPEEAHQLVRLLVDQTAWGPASNIVKLKVGELTRWNGAFTNHWPKKAEKTVLIQAIPELEGWEVTFATEPIDDQKPSGYTFQSFTVLVDKDRVMHWRTSYPWRRPDEALPTHSPGRYIEPKAPPPPPPPPIPPAPRH
jgi:beta-lactamase regulating signal transducer with metallopeptidase domain